MFQGVFYYIFVRQALLITYIYQIAKKNISLNVLTMIIFKISICVVYFFSVRKLPSGNNVRQMACTLRMRSIRQPFSSKAKGLAHLDRRAIIHKQNKLNFIFTKKTLKSPGQ